MKLWLTTNKNVPFEASTYKVISPLNGDSPLDLDKFADNNECDEIVIEDILSFIPYINIQLYIQKVATKLAHSGKLTITGIDCMEVCKEYYYGQINIEQFNNLLFGTKENAWSFRQSAITLFEVNEYIKSCGLRIIQKRLPHLQFSITAQRD